MRTIAFSPVVILFIFRLAFCQEFTLSGFLEDGETGERLIGANVFDPAATVGTTTNVYGFFSLTLNEAVDDSMLLAVSYIGYERWQKRLATGKDLELYIKLRPRVIGLDSVTVIAETMENIEDRTEMSAIEIPMTQLKMVPALLGEVDVIKSIQLLPGVQSGAEGSSGLYVRGGAPDQNLILLDGAPVYNASHLFGFFSVFNSDAVKNVKLTKGGFPARFGGRLSSVVEINMKDGNNQEFNGQATLGLISSRLMLEGPLRKHTSSFIVSARRTYADLLVKPFLDDDENGGYYFADLNAKVNHMLSGKNRLYLSLYAGLDKFYFQSQRNEGGESYYDLGNLRWGNITSTLRWNSLINKKLFCNTTLLYSKYRFTVEVEETSRQTGGDLSESYLLKYFSGIEDYGARLDLDLHRNPYHYIKFGGTATAHKFSPGAAQFQVTGLNISDLDTLVAPTQEQKAGAASLYFEHEMKLTEGIKFNAGVHASAFATGARHFLSVQPRLSTRFLIKNWALKASYAGMNQHIHLLSNVGIGLPTDLWLPSTERVRPQESKQVAFGVARSFSRNKFELSVECYYKTMDNLIEYKEGADFAGLDVDWQNKIEVGSGRSYGAELFVQKKHGRITGWLGYTLSWTDRRFENISSGRRFPSRYDRRNDAAFTFNYQLSGSLHFSGTWVYGTGNAISLPIATYPSEPQILSYAGNFGEQIEYLPERNSLRMRAYHRLDLAIQFIKHKGTRERILTVGLYNTYSRRNPFFYFLSNDRAGNPVIKQVSLFPIIPAISYRFGF
jgi:hypothetical protein